MPLFECIEIQTFDSRCKYSFNNYIVRAKGEIEFCTKEFKYLIDADIEIDCATLCLYNNSLICCDFYNIKFSYIKECKVSQISNNTEIMNINNNNPLINVNICYLTDVNFRFTNFQNFSELDGILTCLERNNTKIQVELSVIQKEDFIPKEIYINSTFSYSNIKEFSIYFNSDCSQELINISKNILKCSSKIIQKVSIKSSLFSPSESESNKHELVEFLLTFSAEYPLLKEIDIEGLSVDACIEMLNILDKTKKLTRSQKLQTIYANEKLDIILSQVNASQNSWQTIDNAHIGFQLLPNIIIERLENTQIDESNNYLREKTKKVC